MELSRCDFGSWPEFYYYSYAVMSREVRFWQESCLSLSFFWTGEVRRDRRSFNDEPRYGKSASVRMVTNTPGSGNMNRGRTKSYHSRDSGMI